MQYDPNLVAQSSGASVFLQTAPTESAANNAAMKQLVDDVKKTAPDQAINQSVIAGYLSADMFLAAVQKAGKDLTVGKLISATSKNFTYQLQGVVGPTKFPAAHSAPAVWLAGAERRRDLQDRHRVHVRQGRQGHRVRRTLLVAVTVAAALTTGSVAGAQTTTTTPATTTPATTTPVSTTTTLPTVALTKATISVGGGRRHTRRRDRRAGAIAPRTPVGEWPVAASSTWAPRPTPRPRSPVSCP
ncbi:MAG: ABC transporter substrate-binding protein [Acidimicrobiia bacterium]